MMLGKKKVKSVRVSHPVSVGLRDGDLIPLLLLLLPY